MQIYNKNFDQITFFLISLLYLAIAYFFFLKFGPMTGGDGFKYIDGTKKILNYQLLDGKQSFFYSYSLFLTPYVFFKLDFLYLSILQLFIFFISGLTLKKLINKYTNSLISLFGFSLYLINPPLIKWALYTMPESLFVSCTVFLIYFFYKKNLFLIFLFSLIIFFLKPQGILIALSVISVILLNFFQRRNFFEKLILSLIFIITIIYTFEYSNKYFKEEKNFFKYYESGQIIYGYNEILISDQKNSFKKNEEMKPTSFLINFYTNDIIYTSKLLLKKTYFFLTRLRPYNSNIHNYYLMITLLPIIILFIISFFELKVFKKFIFLYLIILYNYLSIIISWVEWNGRFSIVILPPLIIISMLVINSFFFKGKFTFK